MNKKDIFYILGGIFIIILGGIFIYLNNINKDDKDNLVTTKVITTTTSTSTTSTTTSTTTTSTTSTTTTLSTSTSNVSTTLNTTSKKITTTKKDSGKKVIVNQTYKDDDKISYKYGVKIIDARKYLVTIYSDGTDKSELIQSSTTLDRSGFKASTKDLVDEAKTLASKNKVKYEELLKYLNSYRTDVSAKPLWLDNDLSVLATIRALEIGWGMGIDKMAHTRPDGRKWSTVYTDMEYFYTAAGENIAAGQQSTASVSLGWKNSPGHYANMINTDFTKVGFGYVEVDNIKYWVQLFAK